MLEAVFDMSIRNDGRQDSWADDFLHATSADV